jgi:hypothetical protein
MLRGVCGHLSQAGFDVSVVARDGSRLAHMQSDIKAIYPLPLDYRDAESLRDAIQRASLARGPFELAVCWIHSTARDAPRIVAETIASPARPRYFHVLGSAVADPSLATPSALEVASVPGIRYRKVILGFQLQGETSRWLTDAEIVLGVIDAIEKDRSETIVGTVGPWSRRP